VAGLQAAYQQEEEEVREPRHDEKWPVDWLWLVWWTEEEVDSF
jgi:hypothetical protein